MFLLLVAEAFLMPVPLDAWFPGTSSIDEVEVIPPAYRGRWAPSPVACKVAGSVDIITVKPGGVDYYEAGGRLERVTQAGLERTIKLKLSYEGEGEFWDKIETWSLNEDGSKLTIVGEGKGSPLALVKCGA